LTAPHRLERRRGDGQNWFDLFVPAQCPGETWSMFVRGLAQGDLPAHREPILTRSGASRLIAGQHAAALSQGKWSEPASLGRDITEHRALEERFPPGAVAGRASAGWPAGWAHDFNNLLSVINGYSEMLLLRADLPDPIRADVLEILRTPAGGPQP